MSSVSKRGVVIVLCLVLGFLLTFSGSSRAPSAPPAPVAVKQLAPAGVPPPSKVPVTPKPRPAPVGEPLFAENPLHVAVTLVQARPDDGPGTLAATAEFTVRPGTPLNFERIAFRIPEWEVKETDLVKDGQGFRHRCFWYDSQPARPGAVPGFLEVLGYRGEKATLLWRERVEAKP